MYFVGITLKYVPLISSEILCDKSSSNDAKDTAIALSSHKSFAKEGPDMSPYFCMFVNLSNTKSLKNFPL